MWHENTPETSGGGRPGNQLLKALGADDYALLAPHLELVHGECGQVLYGSGQDVDRVYFPCGSTLVSYVASDQEGREVESILIGREGAVGGIISPGHLPAYCRVVVQFAGRLVRLPVRQMEEARLRSASLWNLLARYADCQIAQVLQAAACNALHSIEQRLAKWILAAMDRTGDSVVPLSHDQFAALLGIGRSYASRVMRGFKEAGILETRRGALSVSNAERLQARTCGCNERVRQHFQLVLPGVYPGAVELRSARTG